MIGWVSVKHGYLGGIVAAESWGEVCGKLLIRELKGESGNTWGGIKLLCQFKGSGMYGKLV